MESPDVEAGSERQRLELAHEFKFVHDNDIWMEDGNLIVAATDGFSEQKATYAFKCHRSMLSKQSTVFEGLLGIPPSNAAQDVYEGLPLITLPDQYTDVKKLLYSLYASWDLPPNSQEPWEVVHTDETMKSIAGLYRLVVKYEFTNLRPRLEHLMRSIWPTTLSAMDTRQKWFRRHKELIGATREPLRAASAILLGGDTQLTDIIPGAFYILNYDFFNLAGSHETGWCYKPRPAPQSLIYERMKLLTHGLTLPQFLQWLSSQQTLQVLSVNLLSWVLPKVTLYGHFCKGTGEGGKSDESRLEMEFFNAPRQAPCATAIKAWWEDILPPPGPLKDHFNLQIPIDLNPGPPSTGSATTFADPLYTLSRLIEECTSGRYDEKICEECRMSMVQAFENTREFIWNELPYIFLLKEKEAGTEENYECPDYLKEHFYGIERLKESGLLRRYHVGLLQGPA